MLISKAQTSFNLRVPNSAVPFLLSNVEPRLTALGGINVVGISGTFSGDYTSNPSLYAGYENGIKIGAAYTPYSIRTYNGDYEITKEIYLITHRLQSNFKDKNAIGYDFKYFNLGEIVIYDVFGPVQVYNPKELAFKVFYSRLFKGLRLGVAAAFIRSDLLEDFSQKYVVNTVAFDIGIDGFKTKYIKSSSSSYTFNYGISIQNLGPKLKYSDSQVVKDVLPTVFKGGMTHVFQIQPNNNSNVLTRIYIGYQGDKLLVPTPSIEDEDNNGIFDYEEKKWAGQVFGSLLDAPDGLREEIREIQHHVGGGVEIILFNKVMYSINVGYCFEHETKGARKYISVGPAIGIRGVNLEYAYNLNRSSLQSPLRSIHQFGLNFKVAFDRPRSEYNDWTNPSDKIGLNMEKYDPIDELLEN